MYWYTSTVHNTPFPQGFKFYKRNGMCVHTERYTTGYLIKIHVQMFGTQVYSLIVTLLVVEFFVCQSQGSI